MTRPGYTLRRRLARQRRGARDARTGDGPPPPGFWPRLEAGVTRARSLLLSAAAFGVVGLLGWSITQELRRDPVIIEPLTVPESLAKAGWTGEVLARQIRDGVREINEGASTRRARADYLFDREQLDIVVPGASVSIRTLVTVVRGVLGLPARRVAGEVVELENQEHPASCTEAAAAGSRYLLVGRLSIAGRWTACAGTVGELPKVAARELVLATTPYIYASYLYEHDPAQAKALAEAILSNQKARGDHAAALNLLGLMLEDRKQFGEAIGKYEEAVRRDSSFAPAYNNWGLALLDLKRPEEAIGKYEEGLRHDPGLATAYYNWGNALLDLKRPEEAIGKYEEALRRDPGYADAYYNWAVALRELGRDNEAASKQATYECLAQGTKLADCPAAASAPAAARTARSPK